MWRSVGHVAVCLLVGACAAKQLNSNTLDLAASLDSLTTKQVLYNLGRALDDDSFVPSQVSIAAGSASTTNSVSPSVSIPLTPSSSVTTTTSFSNPQSGGVSAQAGLASVGLNVAVQDLWQQGWTLDPVGDADQLRRLTALYRYAVGSIATEQEFLCQYPIQSAAKGLSYRVDCPVPGGHVEFVANPAFSREPGCVVCLALNEPRGKEPPTVKAVYVNHQLRHHFIGRGRSNDFPVFLQSYGLTDFYVTNDPGKIAFQQFKLFIFEAMGQSNAGGEEGAGTPTTTGTGGGGKKPRNVIFTAPNLPSVLVQ